MASFYKPLNSEDVAVTKTPLYEGIPLTGSLISSSVYTSPSNIKTYTHGMFDTVYDYPYTSASANQLFDMTVGISSASAANYTFESDAQRDVKINIYNQMCQVLNGYESDNSIKKFKSGYDSLTGSDFNEVMFLTFSRLLVKDEIKKGTFELKIGTGSYATPFNSSVLTIKDTGSFTDSPTGEYGYLTVTNGTVANPDIKRAGIIFYQAGVVALSTDVFAASGTLLSPAAGSIDSNRKGLNATAVNLDGLGNSVLEYVTGSSISDLNTALRHRIQNISFNNTTEVNSTIYFCRANHNEFNYSTNPTYLSSSQIVVKKELNDAPVSYVTTVGLYGEDNVLLAVAKLSEPIKKTPDESILLRVRLDV